MNVWTLVAPEKLVREEEELPATLDGELKIRVTDVLVNGFDLPVYSGAVPAKYPVVLGRFALGRVASENGSEDFKKGTRVFLHAIPEEEDTGVEKVDFSADPTQVRGLTDDGFLRDFINLPEAELTAVPENVSDEGALLAELVALAKATIDTLDIQKGKHIAVIGGDLLGLIICRLLIYQQASPILIDNYTSRIAFAKQCGVYYTSPADDTLMENIARITGGRLASGAIFVTSSGPQDKTLPFKVCKMGASAVYCGLYGHDFSLNMSLALKKQISVFGVTDGREYLSTALNLLANKAVDASVFKVKRTPVEKVETLFEELSKASVEKTVGELNLVQLI